MNATVRPVEPIWPFDDRIPADNQTKTIDYIPIPQDAEVAYGAFYYQDWLRREHRFRFILKLEFSRTMPIVDGVDESYKEWD